MLAGTFALLLAEAALLQDAFCSQNIATAQDSSVLRPINLRDYESATGLRRRSEEYFSDLDPSAQSQLIYGRPGGTYLDLPDVALRCPSLMQGNPRRWPASACQHDSLCAGRATDYLDGKIRRTYFGGRS